MEEKVTKVTHIPVEDVSDDSLNTIDQFDDFYQTSVPAPETSSSKKPKKRWSTKKKLLV